MKNLSTKGHASYVTVCTNDIHYVSLLTVTFFFGCACFWDWN